MRAISVLKSDWHGSYIHISSNIIIRKIKMVKKLTGVTYNRFVRGNGLSVSVFRVITVI